MNFSHKNGYGGGGAGAAVGGGGHQSALGLGVL